MKLKNNIIALLALVATVSLGALTSCSDEPDQGNFYTFTGQMASDYLRDSARFSSFAKVVERANLMDLLASYGRYTVFVPDNDAFNDYLAKRGKQSLDDLSEEDCDTIAMTHIVANMYSTMDMNGTQLHDVNMLHTAIATLPGMDDNGNAVIFLNTKGAHIYYNTQNDSVENAIMQPINQVLDAVSGNASEILATNTEITTFYAAYVATGLSDEFDKQLPEDPNWNSLDYELYEYVSDFWHEVAWAPDTKKTGYTIFIEPDSVLKEKYGIQPGDVRALYDLACTLYDPVYPDDVAKEGHKYENLTDSINPLRRFMQYHFLNRMVNGGTDLLTPLIMQNTGKKLDGTTLGYDEDLLNPVDWHETLLPHTMAKVEYLTIPEYLGGDERYQRYVNRRYDAKFKIHGQKITADVNMPAEFTNRSPNAVYFYIDDVMAFTKEVRDQVQNMRIRMDFAAIFPELITNNLRQKGDYTTDDDSGTPDRSDTPKNGKNYYFPLGYLKDVTFTGNCAFVYRRPHWNFWSFEGDEFNIFGDYDFTFRIPPVPFSGEWQVRLGFCALRTRGVAQIYFGSDPKHMQAQGIPMDMTSFITDDDMLGLTDLMPTGDTREKGGGNETTNMESYEKIRKDPEQLAESMKAFKNLGIVRGPYGTYHTGGDTKTRWCGNWRTYRRILYQGTIDASKDQYIRIRVASDGKQGNNNEFMLDYLELVPKNVYEIGGANEMEDDL